MKLLSIPRLPLSRESANLGLFCFSKASWSGLARNISLIILGSSSTGGARDPIPELVGTSMLPKSIPDKPLGNPARQNNFIIKCFYKKSLGNT